MSISLNVLAIQFSYDNENGGIDLRKVLLTEPIHPSGIKILEEQVLVVVSSSTDTATH